MANPSEHPRLILRNFLSLNQCRELEFIHKSCCTVGYRPSVFSTTLSHLIATNSAHLIMPFVPIREYLKEKVEEYFGCDYELCIEFTGLISWTRGSSIGWHSDDNRPYLKQRDFAAVCYLNNFGEDFKGGLFHFQDGEPKTIVPMAGDVVLYTADSQNIHSVDEITDGERLTLTLWFTRDSSYDEDAKLVSFLSRKLLHEVNNGSGSWLPVPASINMYWLPPNQGSDDNTGFNICYARIYTLGYDTFISKEEPDASASVSSNSIEELLIERIQLAWGEELFGKKFINILHALQVLQFYRWKAFELLESGIERNTYDTMTLTQLQMEKVNNLKLRFMKDPESVKTVFGYLDPKNDECNSHDWAGFSAAITAWEAYTKSLGEAMLISLPHWTAQGFLFSVSLTSLGNES